jgi:dATP/dGTP diphosphohydrolase/uncharacterized protein DUF4406
VEQVNDRETEFSNILRGIEQPKTGYPRCYIAGPMRGYESFNFPAFDLARDELVNAGWSAFSPADADRDLGWDDGSERNLWEYMEHDLAAVARSDALFMLEGWEDSQGATLEFHNAKVLGIPCYRWIDGLEILTEDEATQSATDFGESWRETYEPTGGQKGRREATMSLIPVYALVQEARVHGSAVRKYPDEAPGVPNWSKGTPYSWMADALLRHFYTWLTGQSFDEESGLHNLAHVRWMCATLMEFERLGVGLDDRRRQ